MSQSNTTLQVVDAAGNVQNLVVSQDQSTGYLTPYHYAVVQVGGANVTAVNPLPSVIEGSANVTIQLGGVGLSNANPIPVTITGGGLSVNGSSVSLSTGGSLVTNANPLPTSPQGTANVSVLVGGLGLSNANPVPVSVQAGAPLTVNGGTFTPQVGGANVAAGNPLPVTVSNGALTVTSGTISLVTSSNNGLSSWCASGAANAVPQLTNAPVNVATGQRSLRGFDFINESNSVIWIQVFDLPAGSVTLGTTAPKMTKYVPAGPGGVWEEKFSDDGVFFANAISMAATSTPTGNGAPANTVIANVIYK